jgi:hypothetical protein
LANDVMPLSEKRGGCEPPPKSINGYHRLGYSRRSKFGWPSIGALGRHKPHLFHGESAINRFFGCGDGACLGVRLARDNFASNGRGPFPQVAADALHERVFDISIFHCHGTDAICAAGTVGGCIGPLSIYNPPAINITAANTIANIAVTRSSTSFIVLRRTARIFANPER